MDEDIPIPKPRTRADAKQWFCSNCGGAGNPDLTIPVVGGDERFAIGTHTICTRPYRQRYPTVQFVADWAWDRDKWQAQKDELEYQRIAVKARRGALLTPAEQKKLQRYLEAAKSGGR